MNDIVKKKWRKQKEKIKTTEKSVVIQQKVIRLHKAKGEEKNNV